MVSCFLLHGADNLRDIHTQWGNAAELSKIGGGVGICLTDLREEGAPILGVDDRASGVIPVAKVFEDIFSYVDQLGTRPGAGIVYISMLHMDAPTLIEAKKENVDEKVRLKMLNIGLVVPDIAYFLAAENQDLCLFSSHDIQKEYNRPMSQFNLTKHYWELVNNPKIRRRKVNARDYFQTISGIQMESGYPFIMNEDTVNNANMVDGYISHSNLCTEILQPSVPSTYHKDGTYDQVGRDISCNLCSLNVYKALYAPSFEGTVKSAVEMCTAVSDMTHIEAVPPIARGNDLSHSIGIGGMNLHGAFGALGMAYGEKDSLHFTDAFFMSLKFYAMKASMELAKLRGKKFYNFEKSKYATGEAFDYYLKTDYHHIIPKHIRDIFVKAKGFKIPTVADWIWLKEQVMLHGMYNQNLLATAPTGSISYINHASASIHPISSKIEERMEGKVYAYYPAPHMTNENKHLFEDAFEVGWKKIIDVYAEAGKHIDQGASLTLSFQEETTTTRTIDQARYYAWRKGVKTLYYIRARQKSLSTLFEAPVECEACAV